LKALFTLLLALVCLSSMAQTGVEVPELAHCDASMQQFMQRWNVLGASVALSKDGRLVYERAFGYADAARTQPLQPHHLLRVASVSKCVTAVAILKLAEEGRLDLGHRVFGPAGYLPDAAYTQEIRDPRIYDITVQQLLEHTAGWDRAVGCDGRSGCDPVDFPTRVAKAMGVPGPVGDSTIIRYMLRQGLNTAPGTHFAYSNVGYLVLGKVLEALARQPYEAWVQAHVLEPAGILEAALGHNLPADRHEREAEYQSRVRMPSCYRRGRRVPAAYGGFQVEAMNAHGGWLFSARDLVRFLTSVDGFASVPDILAPASIEAMATGSGPAPWYAKGWVVNNGTWWHTGQLDGTAALVARTATGLTWAILLNTDHDTEAFWAELQALGWGWQAGAAWPAHNLLPPEQNAADLRLAATADAESRLYWHNGNGTRRLLLLKPDSPSTAFPLDGTVYAAGSTLPDSTVVLSNGPESSAPLPALDPARTYFARVVEYRQDATTAQQPLYALEGNPTLVLRPDALPPRLVQLAMQAGPPAEPQPEGHSAAPAEPAPAGALEPMR